MPLRVPLPCAVLVLVSCGRPAPLEDLAEPLAAVPEIAISFETTREVDGPELALIRERVTLVVTSDVDEERFDLGLFEGACHPIDPIGLPGARGAVVGLACNAGRTGSWLHAGVDRGDLVVRAAGYSAADDTLFRELERLDQVGGFNVVPSEAATAALVDRDRGADPSRMRRYERFLDLPTSLYEQPEDPLDLDGYRLLDDVFVRGVPCRKLEPLALYWTHGAFALRSCTLATDATLGGLELASGDQVELWPDGSLKAASKLATAQSVDGVLAIPYTRLELNPDGTVRTVLPAVPVTVGGVHCDAERLLRVGPGEEVLECTLARDSRVDGLTLRGGTRFSRDGRPYLTLAEPHRFGDLPLPAGTTVHFAASEEPVRWAEARVRHVVPPSPLTVAGLELAARKLVTLDWDGDRPLLRYGHLGAPRRIGGATLPYDTAVEFGPGGALTQIQLEREAEIDGQSWAPGSILALEDGTWRPGPAEESSSMVLVSFETEDAGFAGSPPLSRSELFLVVEMGGRTERTSLGTHFGSCRTADDPALVDQVLAVECTSDETRSTVSVLHRGATLVARIRGSDERDGTRYDDTRTVEVPGDAQVRTGPEAVARADGTADGARLLAP